MRIVKLPSELKVDLDGIDGLQERSDRKDMYGVVLFKSGHVTHLNEADFKALDSMLTGIEILIPTHVQRELLSMAGRHVCEDGYEEGILSVFDRLSKYKTRNVPKLVLDDFVLWLKVRRIKLTVGVVEKYLKEKGYMDESRNMVGRVMLPASRLV